MRLEQLNKLKFYCDDEGCDATAIEEHWIPLTRRPIQLSTLTPVGWEKRRDALGGDVLSCGVCSAIRRRKING